MAKSWFDSIYDYITGENYDTDPNTPENRIKRLENPQPYQPNPLREGRDVPTVGPIQMTRSAWEEMFGSSSKSPKQ